MNSTSKLLLAFPLTAVISSFDFSKATTWFPPHQSRSAGLTTVLLFLVLTARRLEVSPPGKRVQGYAGIRPELLMPDGPKQDSYIGEFV